MAKKGLYCLHLDDLQIFSAAWKYQEDAEGNVLRCASYFTSYYLRKETQPSGWEFDKNIIPPWQLKMHHAHQRDIIIISGQGAGKTLAVGMSALVYCTLFPGFQFMNTAPTANQSQRMFKLLRDRIIGTLFQERFTPDKENIVSSPYPAIRIHYRWPVRREEWIRQLPEDFVAWADHLHAWDSEVQGNSLEFMSTDKNAKKILTAEVDYACIDQAEGVEDLELARINMGTRTRGIRPDGTSRMGRLVLLANAEDNPFLWEIFDEARLAPEEVLGMQISTRTNKNINDEQMAAILRRIKDPAKLNQYLDAERPLGAGIEFSKELVQNCHDPHLDAFVGPDVPPLSGELAIDYAEGAAGMPVLWAMPPIKEHVYVVIGDPGTGKPPGRNAPVVLVFDMTEYPEPAALQAFWWGDGGGQYGPFINQMLLWNEVYRCANLVYEGTAGQKVFGETAFAQLSHVVGIDLSGVKKRMHIITLKLMMQKNRLKWPAKLTGINWQFLKYKLPDEKISQDIVSAFIVLAGYVATWLGYEEEPTKLEDPKPLPATGADRYHRPVANRNARAR